MNPLVRRLVQIRRAKRVSQRGVSARAGLATGACRRWEAGMHEPALGNFEAALNVLGYRLEIVPLEPKP